MTTATATCRRVDGRGNACGGEIEDGVCGTCGRPELAGSLIAPMATARVGTGTQSRTGTTGVGRTGSGRISRRHTNASSTSRRQSLGGGLVSLPPVPSADPEQLVMATPEVAPARRSCPHCSAKVNRMKGFCPQCAKPYDFNPRLKRGDVVAGKYEIKGPIGLGGMGWIYLGTDVVLQRWVVLKGVLNASDPEAAAAAVAERQFLAAVKDPKIVQIYDFVAQGAEGYMVLEYVGGRTVDQIRADEDVVDLLDEKGRTLRSGVKRRDIDAADRALVAKVTTFGVLPPEQAVAYVLAICPAFSYLHAKGFTHNDVKPDNIMVEGDAVKLLDLGAMRRIGDEGGLIFGTEGFFAPEASEDPVAVSDLYALGRSLAILLMDFLYKARADTDQATGKVTTRRLIVTGYKTAIPPPSEQPVLARIDSLYRFLLRATHEDPDQRFQSAEEMEGQLFGILREIMSGKTGPKPADSKVFFGDGLVNAADREGVAGPIARTLPLLRLDPGDVAAGDLVGAAAVIDPLRRVDTLKALVGKRPASVEAKLRLAEALTLLADTQDEPQRARSLADAIASAEKVLAADEFEWRAHWYAGKAYLALGDANRARSRFDRTYFEMPGDIGPKLGIATAAEASGDHATARRFYAIITTMDPAYASAAFGAARSELKAADTPAARDAAIAALARVPPSSSMFAMARLTLAEVALGRRDLGWPHLTQAADALVEAGGGARAAATKAALFEAAMELLKRGMPAPPGDIAGIAPTEARLGRGAEAAYLAAARLAASAADKSAYVDRAHAARPVTLI